MEKLLSVQEIALKSGITAYTLRYYESLGILRPQRDKNNRRVYSDFDMEQISCITTLRKMNVPLTKIIEFHKLKFIGKSTIEDRIELLQQHFEYLASLKSKMEEDMDFIKLKIDRLRGRIDE